MDENFGLGVFGVCICHNGYSTVDLEHVKVILRSFSALLWKVSSNSKMAHQCSLLGETGKFGPQGVCGKYMGTFNFEYVKVNLSWGHLVHFSANWAMNLKTAHHRAKQMKQFGTYRFMRYTCAHFWPRICYFWSRTSPFGVIQCTSHQIVNNSKLALYMM